MTQWNTHKYIYDNKILFAQQQQQQEMGAI